MSSAKAYLCPRCKKTFNRASNRSQHVRQVHWNERMYSCEHCNRPFKRKNDKNKHEVKCILNPAQDNSSALTMKIPNFRKRGNIEDGEPENSPTKKERSSPGVKVVETDTVSVNEDLLPGDDELRRVFTDNWSAIRTHHHRSKHIQDFFNYRLLVNSTEDLESQLYTDVFEKQSCSFKIDVDYGFILRNNESGELRYYHSCQNNSSVLRKPHLVKDKTSFEEFLEIIRNVDILEWAKQQRPDTKWVVEMVTNAAFYVNKILNFPIGTAETLPPYILNNKGLVALQKDENHHCDYNDNLCLFRCIAIGFGESSHSLNTLTYALFHRFVDKKYTRGTFPGIQVDQLSAVEVCFSININVYALRESMSMYNDDDDVDYDTKTENDVFDISGKKSGIVVGVVRRSLGKYDKTINLNLFEQHFSFIANFELYSKRYVCSKCDKMWKTKWVLERHEVTCEGKIKHRYVGGVYHIQPTVFEELEEEGISVNKELRFYPYCATFDFESYFNKRDLPSETDNQKWLAEHVPLSVSICSNVPGFTSPVCYVSEGSAKDLVLKMIAMLERITDAAYNILLSKFEQVLGQIDASIEDSKSREPSCHKAEKKLPLEKLKFKLESWLKELSVFSFNGGKYDINLIKPSLIGSLLEQNKKIYAIKKSNNFMHLRTDHLNFLDMSNFLAPGFSYDKFLKAYQCPINKGFLPYEWIDCLEKLTHPCLPSYEAFYSSLKKQNISLEDYEWCQKIWNDHEMKTFKDFLIFYNNRDVQPFVEAILKMSMFYKENGIDMFKDGISVPGLTLRYLFKDLPRDTYFTLFNNKHSDLHHLVKDNITGGPSIIFHRYHEVGQTRIRENDFEEKAKLCQSIVGFDANALYLNCLMQDMPTGWFVRRRAPEFKAEKSHKYGRMALEWLEFEADRNGVEIRHRFNGKEKRIGVRNLPVDGYCKDTRTVYQLNGCFWHGHACKLNAGRAVNEKRCKSMRELRAETQNNSDYVKKLGYTLKEMWECEWVVLKKTPRVKTFLQRFFPRKVCPWKRMSESDILKNVTEGHIFGMVECDIEVPTHLYDHFSEMQPIFKNTEVSKDDIGSHMRDHANSHGYLKQPRRMLIGSYFGKKILLATPLLKWYLSHGLIVTRIYQILEYEKKSCFKSFGDSVSNARRDGDSDPEKAIVADTMKLLGNSGYGKTVTNKENQRDIKFVNDDYKASELVNEHAFRRLNPLSDTLYELEMNKKTIKLDLPLHIGFFVYQYAKLRMLEFYYDFIDKYVERRDFQYVEMDTDSAYLALSGRDLEEVVKPDMKVKFYEEWENWLPAQACPDHKSKFMEVKLAGKEWIIKNDCCVKRLSFDKRTPGLFKVEWVGKGIIGLCSKTYYCYCFGDGDKLSCKGLNKKQNDLRKDDYLRVLREGKAGKGQNEGFRVKRNKIFTYRETRAGLSYLYPKRIVLDDGISTHPIQI